MVMIDLQQGKNIFNSGITKTDALGNLLTPNDASRNGESVTENEIVSLRSRQHRIESGYVDEEDEEESPKKEEGLSIEEEMDEDNNKPAPVKKDKILQALENLGQATIKGERTIIIKKGPKVQSRLFDYLNKPKGDTYANIMQYKSLGVPGGSTLMQTINPALFDQTLLMKKGQLKPPHHLQAIDEGAKFRNRLQ
jgi:hypothetical protein